MIEKVWFSFLKFRVKKSLALGTGFEYVARDIHKREKSVNKHTQIKHKI